MELERLKKLWILFKNMLYISSFTFGGGFVIVSIMKRKFVDELHWIDDKEMLDFTALAQSSPGAIAVNVAVLTGWRIAGLVGMIVAVLGTIIPPVLILTLLSYAYALFVENIYVGIFLRGMQAGVAAVVLDVACNLFVKLKKEESYFKWMIMLCSFILSYFCHINIVYIIMSVMLIGILDSFLSKRRETLQ